MFRYIIGEALFSFLVAFLFFFFIFFINQLLLVAQDILSKRVPFYQVALLIFYALPNIIALSAPFASLVGILMTIGRMSSDNEILVMLSSGLSYKNIFLPVIIVGVAISLLSFLTNDVLLPAGTVQYQRLWRQILTTTPALELEPNSVKRFRDTVIITGAVDGRSFDDLVIIDRTSDGERRIIMANNAEFVDSGIDGISLDLYDTFVQSSKEIVREDYDYAAAGFLRYFVPQEDIMQAVSYITPSNMSSVDIRGEITTRNEELRQRLDDRFSRSLSSALNLEDSLRQGPEREVWNRRSNFYSAYLREYNFIREMQDDRTIQNYRLEYYKKFSIPFGSFFFVFLAVPLGFLAKRSGQTVGFMFGILISLIYWILLISGQTLGVRLGYSPFWSMWLPNILAGVIGLSMCIVRIRK
jgi:lipopolysaccharide export system permease protein